LGSLMRKGSGFRRKPRTKSKGPIARYFLNIISMPLLTAGMLNSLSSIFRKHALVIKHIFSPDCSFAVVAVVIFLNFFVSCMGCGVVAINLESANVRKKILLLSCSKFIINIKGKLS
jgi:hypothetical protein